MSLIAQVIGGIGLFLVGVELMRIGFKEAAGNSLRRILSDHTDTTPKGILSGFLVSSAVQSASAVTITLIGLVNAHLMRLRRAVTVVFGSNLGKITTAWLIATLGLKGDISAFALPLVGVGFLLRAFLKKRFKGYGLAVIGFALLFLGINILKTSMAGVADQIDLSGFARPGLLSDLVLFALGVTLTVITQSSSAGLTITLAALIANIISLESAAVVLIGLNLGTTSSSYLAAMRTSPNAKRLAASHVLFNLFCTVVGFGLLYLVFYVHAFGIVRASMAKDPVMGLTVFYTAFIFTTLVLVVPFEKRIVRRLKRHFMTTGALGNPVHIRFDKRHLPPPEIAEQALKKEVIRFGRISLDMLRDSLTWTTKNGWVYGEDLSDKEYELDRLNESIHKFASYYTRHRETNGRIDRLHSHCRAAQHYGISSDFSCVVSKSKNNLTERLDDELLDRLNSWSEDIDDLVKDIKPIIENGHLENLRAIHVQIKHTDDERRALRQQLIEESILGTISSSTTNTLIDIIENTRRSVRELLRGTYKLWETRNVADLKVERELTRS